MKSQFFATVRLCAYARRRRRQAGFTAMEMVVTVAIILIMASAAMPLLQQTLAQFRLRAATTSVTGAIQTTRFQAISNGYQYKLAINKAGRTYQLSSDPTGAGTFTNIGGALPYSNSGTPVAVNADAVLQFSPSGKVTFINGGSPLVLTLQGQTSTITVSTYGNLSVKYGS